MNVINIAKLPKKSLELAPETIQLINDILQNPEKFRDILIIVNKEESEGIVSGKFTSGHVHYDCEKLIGMLEFCKFCLISQQVSFK